MINEAWGYHQGFNLTVRVGVPAPFFPSKENNYM